MTQTLRVLHILRAPSSGLFRHVRDLALEQARWGLDVGILCDAASFSGPAGRYLAKLGPCLPLGLHLTSMGRSPGLTDIRAVAETRRLTRELDIDVLHGHGLKGGLYARLGGTLPAGRNGLAPLRVYSPHGRGLRHFNRSMKGNVVVTAEAAMLRLTDGLIFDSASARDRYADSIRIESVPHRVIYNGLSEVDFAQRELCDDAADFLFVGELLASKGVDVMLDALHRLDASEARAVIVGDGPEASRLKASAYRLGLGARVVFAGAVPLQKAFSLGRILVLPSRSESLPYVALEAAAAGVPIVATKVGGVPEIIEGSDTRLVPCGDADALACAMAVEADDFGAAQARAQRLRKIVQERFSTAQMVRSVMACYRDGLLRISTQAPLKVSETTEFYCNGDNS